MPVKFDEIANPETNRGMQPRWETIVLGEGKSFDVKLCPPTFDERIRDTDRGGCSVRRITRSVRGWRGIQDAQGQEMHFNRNELTAICEANPTVFRLLGEVVNKLYECPNR